jgi:AcrR family transcriptional regulator
VVSTRSGRRSGDGVARGGLATGGGANGREGVPGRGHPSGRDGVVGGHVASGDGGTLSRRGLPGRERVGELQRARILAAMTELVRERGVGGVAVAHVVGRSGVSRRTFYELFEDRDDCLLAAFDRAVQYAAAVVLPAYEAAAGERWEEQIRAALAALLGFLEQEPVLGGLCVVDALAAERVLLEPRARIVNVLVDAVHRGTPTGKRSSRRGVTSIAQGKHGTARSASGASLPGGARPPGRIVAEGIVGAVLAVIHARMCEPNPKPLSGLLRPLMGIVVLPYLGSAAAERELARPAPRARKRPTPPSDPLRELDMRLTYRTVRVLLAIAELGGLGSNPSGRQVADAAGVSDQGQISKLLWRLEHLGLIHNHAPSSAKGEPNAWSLTPKGHQIEQAIRTQTNS